MERPAGYPDLDRWFDWKKLPACDTTVTALFAHWVREAPDREFLVFDGEHATYRQVDEDSKALARQLVAAGAGKGTRVGMMIPNCVAFVVSWLALVRIGAVPVTISTLSTGPEIRKIAKHSDIQLLLATDRYLHHDYVARFREAFTGIERGGAPHRLAETPYLREVWIWGDNAPAWTRRIDLAASCDVDPALVAAMEAELHVSDAISIIYTSGSTAEPKGVIHTHGSFMRQSRKLAATNAIIVGERLYSMSPLFWVGGLTYTLLMVMQVGGTVLGSTRAGAELLDFIQAERVSYFTGWPHLARALENDPSFPGRSFPHLRGGVLEAALPPEKRSGPGQSMGNILGMTESGGPHTFHAPPYPAGFEAAFGRFMPGMQHRVVDTATRQPLPDGEAGELQIRGDALFSGMVKRERADVFTPDGWYGTGDLCSIRDGFLFFHGRVDDMIKSSGANVSPREVEAVLMGLPGVAQAFVTGVQDRQRWNVVGALIVPKPGATLDRESIRAQAAQQLSAYKLPRVILFVDSSKIPLMSSTKIDRRALVKMLSEEASRNA